MSYTIKNRDLFHGKCLPGYEKVASYKKKSGARVEEHCRKIRASGRVGAMAKGIYNEGMIAQEDVRLGIDSTLDFTKDGSRVSGKMEQRAGTINNIMKKQESKKEDARKYEEK